MNYSLYQNNHTIIHRLDPRTKLFALASITALLYCFDSPFYIGFVFLFILLLGLLAKSIVRIWSMRLFILAMALLSIISWSFYLGGKTQLWTWWIFTVYQESFLYGIGMALRLVSLFIVGIIFMATTKPDEFYAALILIRIPYPPAFVFSLAMRLVPMMAGTMLTIIDAQVSRGLDIYSGNLFSRIRKTISLIVPLIISTLRQANFMTIALEARGFVSYGKRTMYQEYLMQRKDYFVIIILIFSVVIGIALRIAGFSVIFSGSPWLNGH